MNIRKTDFLDDYKNQITHAIKSLKEYYQEQQEKPAYSPRLEEGEFVKYVLSQVDHFLFFSSTKQLIEKAQKQINIAKETVNTAGLSKNHGLILKNNSPIFRIPNKELSRVNNLVDKTPIDPYHPWAVVPYSGK